MYELTYEGHKPHTRHFTHFLLQFLALHQEKKQWSQQIFQRNIPKYQTESIQQLELQVNCDKVEHAL